MLGFLKFFFGRSTIKVKRLCQVWLCQEELWLACRAPWHDNGKRDDVEREIVSLQTRHGGWDDTVWHRKSLIVDLPALHLTVTWPQELSLAVCSNCGWLWNADQFLLIVAGVHSQRAQSERREKACIRKLTFLGGIPPVFLAMENARRLAGAVLHVQVKPYTSELNQIFVTHVESSLPHALF